MATPMRAFWRGPVVAAAMAAVLGPSAVCSFSLGGASGVRLPSSPLRHRSSLIDHSDAPARRRASLLATPAPIQRWRKSGGGGGGGAGWVGRGAVANLAVAKRASMVTSSTATDAEVSEWRKGLVCDSCRTPLFPENPR